jgi:glycosyltransferase involved in cell wall biosynthesis
MYSTQNNICKTKFATETNKVCRSCFRIPQSKLNFINEGGLRTKGIYKKNMHDKPLVSIITPVYNQQNTIEQCILSVLTQSYDNIEYIIIDAASTDNTLEIIKKYENGIDYYISEPDSGIYAGINKGLSLASGEYILILNSDDWYTNDAVSELVKLALRNNSQITAAHAIMLDSNDRQKSINKSIWGPQVYILCTLRHETMLVKRDTYEIIGGYDDSKQIISDWLWILKAYEFCVKVAILDKNVLFFRIGGASEKTNPQRLQERREGLMTNLHIDDKDTIDHLMAPHLLCQKKKNMLKKKHPENHKLFRALGSDFDNNSYLASKLARLYATKSWKITKPLRVLERFITKI